MTIGVVIGKQTGMKGKHYDQLKCPSCGRLYVQACAFLATGGHWIVNYSPCIGRYSCDFKGGIVRRKGERGCDRFVSHPVINKIDSSIFV